MTACTLTSVLFVDDFDFSTMILLKKNLAWKIILTDVRLDILCFFYGIKLILALR